MSNLPPIQIIFYWSLFNVFMFVLSFTLQAHFGGTAFITTGVDEHLNTIIALPEITDVGFITALTNILNFLFTSIYFLLAIMTFEVHGLHLLIRALITFPMLIVNVYILLGIFTEIAHIVSNAIPFT